MAASSVSAAPPVSVSELEQFLFDNASSLRHAAAPVEDVASHMVSEEEKSRKKQSKRKNSGSRSASKAIVDSAEAVASPEAVHEEAAWVDSDDERLLLDISKIPKLRKLRNSKNEKNLKGKELQKRLKKLHFTLRNSAQAGHAASTSMYLLDKSDEAVEKKSDWIISAMRRQFSNKRTLEKKISFDGGIASTVGLSDSEAEETIENGLYNPITGQDLMLSRVQPSRLRQKTNRGLLKPHKIDIKQVEDIGKEEFSKSAIRNIGFHSNSSTFFSMSCDSKLRLFKVDAEYSERLEMKDINKYRVTEAAFASDYASIRMLTASKTLVEYDLETGEVSTIPGICGRQSDKCYRHLCMGPAPSGSMLSSLFAMSTDADGYILLCDAKTKRLIRSVKLNADCAGISFNASRNSLLAADTEAFMYEWDIGSGRCIQRYHDTSSLGVTSLSSSYKEPNLFAVGTRSGFLNLHLLNGTGQPYEPAKTFGNLTTPITSIGFHPSSQLLCYASKYKPGALRLVHLPSRTVYSNFPVDNKKLPAVTCVDFSNHSGYLAVGNQLGKVQLFQIDHFV